MIRVSDLVDDDVTPSNDLLKVVAPPGGPATLPASRLPSRSRHRVAVFNGDSMLGDSVHRTSPVSMVDSEPAVMSIFSSDTDPDMEDELARFQPLQAPVSHVSPNASMGVRELPSRYRAPVAPAVVSAVFSARVSPSRGKEVSSFCDTCVSGL